MTTPTTSLQSRLPDPVKLVPELGEAGAALFEATGNGSVLRTTIGMVQLRRADRREHLPERSAFSLALVGKQWR